jgi:oligopeptide/dipeptide ABC transporter ATP-binding protein
VLFEGEAMTESIIEGSEVVKYFPLRHGVLERLANKKQLNVRAVDSVNLKIGPKETLGLVGESGSGKTTLGRVMLMIEKPTSGRIFFKGQEITNLKPEDLRKMRKKMQMVFQNPNSSLDPRQRIKDILAEPLKAFRQHRNEEIKEIVLRVLGAVGLPEDGMMRFPHEFSGGQRQRVAIARALVLNPEFIILDEPTSALDSSVQAQILNLLRKLQDEFDLSYLFITHNVNVVKYMADRVAVMYCGKMVEVGETQQLLERPLHPYTMTLIASIPKPDPDDKLQAMTLKGEIPSSVNPPSGCRFHPRCPYAKEICRTTEPELREIEGAHWSACHFAEEFKGG